MKRPILIIGALSALVTLTALADPDTDQVTGKSITYTDHDGRTVTEFHQIQQKPTVTVIPDYAWEERFTTVDIDGHLCSRIRTHKVYHLKGNNTSNEVVEEGTMQTGPSDINPHRESIRPSRKRQHEHGVVLDQSYEVLTDW